MTFTTASDTKLAAKAVRENWPMDAEQRAAAIEHLRAIAADPKTRPQMLGVVKRALATAEKTTA